MIERDEPENQLGSSRVEAPARWRRPAARPPRSASRSRPGNPTGNGAERWRRPNGEMGEPAGAAAAARRDDDDDADFPGVPGLPSRPCGTTWTPRSPLTLLSDRDRALCRFMIEALDDDGYLQPVPRRPPALLPPSSRSKSTTSRSPCARSRASTQLASVPPTSANAPACNCAPAARRIRNPGLAIVADHLELPGRPGFPQAQAGPALW